MVLFKGAMVSNIRIYQQNIAGVKKILPVLKWLSIVILSFKLQKQSAETFAQSVSC